MPVILTTPGEIDLWMTALTAGALRLQLLLADRVLTSVEWDKKNGEEPLH
jgi:hypothetical protein